jgi:hypothetical protein
MTRLGYCVFLSIVGWGCSSPAEIAADAGQGQGGALSEGGAGGGALAAGGVVGSGGLGAGGATGLGGATDASPADTPLGQDSARQADAADRAGMLGDAGMGGKGNAGGTTGAGGKTNTGATGGSAGGVRSTGGATGMGGGTSAGTGGGSADGGGSTSTCIGADLLASLGRDTVVIGGSMEDATAAKAPFDSRYLYLSGGLFDGSAPCASCASGCTAGGSTCANSGSGCAWWGCWQWDQDPPGQYAVDFVSKGEKASPYAHPNEGGIDPADVTYVTFTGATNRATGKDIYSHDKHTAMGIAAAKAWLGQ